MALDIMAQIERIPSSAYFVHRTSEPPQKMTYAELCLRIDEYVASLECLKIQAGVRPGNPAILVVPEKSPEFYAFSIACLVTGIAPVMLNPRAPIEQLHKQMTAAKLQFAATHLVSFSSCQTAETICVRAGELGFQNFVRSFEPPKAHVRVPCDRDDDELAWVYFTTGTTGPSKPVAIPWLAARSFIDNLLARVPLIVGTKISQVFSPWFDPYFADILAATLQGATLVPVFEDEAPSLPTLICDEGISVLSTTPSFARLALMRAKQAVGSCTNLRQTIFTGEALSWDLIEAWRALAPHTSVSNFYGPTETTVWIASYEVPSIDFDKKLTGSVPIGRVFSNHEAKISMNGELHIRGPQVCLSGGDVKDGYYHTGDRVRTDQKGNLVWAGRLNETFKVRGQRVNLLDLEQAFTSAARVPVTIAIDKSGLQLSLFSYRPLSRVELESGMESLRQILPANLLPKQFHVLAGSGMDSNGKRIRSTEHLLSSSHEPGFSAEKPKLVSIDQDFKVPQKLLDADHPIFFYSETALLANLNKLRAVLSRYQSSDQILFSVKSNPNPDVLRSLSRQVDGFDVSSFGEHQLVRRICGDVRLTASGPAKSKRWLNIIRDVDVVHIDSLDELEEVLALKDPPGKIALRQAIKSVGLAKLGFDSGGIDRAVERFQHHVGKKPALIGLHFYLGRESFEVAKFEEALSVSQDIFARHKEAFAETRLFIGAGLPSVHILDENFESVKRLEDVIQRSERSGQKLQISWEGGRAILHAAGIYVVSVIAVKDRSEQRLVIVNGGLQHLASNLTSPIFSNRGHRVRVWRPGEGWVNSDRGSTDARADLPTEVFGSLGTWNDKLFLPSKETAMPSVQVGDRIVIFPAGAYGPTAASGEFLGLESAMECFVEASGEFRTIAMENRYIRVPDGALDGE